MKTHVRARMATLGALLLAAACFVFALPSLALGCEGEATVTVSAVVRAYDYGTDLHFVDGLITNDSSVTVAVDKVRVSWAENPSVTSDFWVGCELLAPGDWTTFHSSRPDEAAAGWTVGEVVPYAYKRTGPSAAIALRLNGVSGPVADGDMRVWTASVTNTSSVTVSSVDVIGREMGGTSFVDTLFSWDCPDAIAPGQTVSIEVRGKAPWPSAPTASMRFVALEKPTITLTPDTLSPVYGTPITFRIELRRGDGSLATGGRTLKIYHSFDGETWEDDYFHQETETGFVVTQIAPDRPTYYRAVYWGGGDLGQAMGEWMLATPVVAKSAPAVPARVRVKRPFAVTGRIGAGVASSGKPVTIYAEKKLGRRWVRKVKVTATADAGGAYRKNLKLTSAGSWRIRAYRPGVGYSKYRTVKVR